MSFLKGRVQWFLEYSELYSHHGSLIQNIFIALQRNLKPSSHSPLPLPPWQPLIYFWPLWICLFWTFHLNGIICDVSSCDRLPSLSTVPLRSSQAVACISSFSFFFLSNIPLLDGPRFIYHLPVEGLLNCFQILKLPSTFVCRFLYKHVFVSVG